MDIRDLDSRFVVKRQVPRSTDPGDFIVPCRDGHLFGGEAGGLGAYLSFGTPRRMRARMRKLPFAHIRQEGDAEVVAFIPDADLEEAFRLLHPRRRIARKEGSQAAESMRTGRMDQNILPIRPNAEMPSKPHATEG